MNDWMYEPCDPCDGTLSPTGKPYPHAVRGLKPAGRRVMGYGQTEPDAYTDARDKARQYDAREVLGERGEARASGSVCDTRRVNFEFIIRKIVVHPDFILHDTYPDIVIERDMDVSKDEVRLISESGMRMMVLKIRKDAAHA